MNLPFRKLISTFVCRLTLISLSLASPFAITANASTTFGPTPLLDKVRLATARFWDVNVAIHEGWVPATPCVSGPTLSGTGIVQGPSNIAL
jgi:hypothetical protein